MLMCGKATPLGDAIPKPFRSEAAMRDVHWLPVEPHGSSYPAFSLRRPVMYLCRTLEMRV